MQSEGLKAQVGYRKPRSRKGDSHIITPNRLQLHFNPLVPDEAWVTDITYIRTHEGAVFGCGCGIVLAQSRWLVDAFSNSQRYCAERIADGRVATSA